MLDKAPWIAVWQTMESQGASVGLQYLDLRLRGNIQTRSLGETKDTKLMTSKSCTGIRPIDYRCLTQEPRWSGGKTLDFGTIDRGSIPIHASSFFTINIQHNHGPMWHKLHRQLIHHESTITMAPMAPWDDHNDGTIYLAQGGTKTST